MTVPPLPPRNANVESALFTAKALLSRGGSNDHLLMLLKASSSEVQALLEPFTARLAQMNTARMAASVWDGLFGKAGSRVSAMSAEVWTTDGKCLCAGGQEPR